MSAHQGTVKFFNHEKGFGFITPSDGSKDVFVHKNNVEGHINDGDAVAYDVEQTDKGLSALRVHQS